MKWPRPAPIWLLGAMVLAWTATRLAPWEVLILELAWTGMVAGVVWADHWSAKRKARR